MNFTASWLTFYKRRIFDDLGNGIESMHYETTTYPFIYLKPIVTYDIIDKEKLRMPVIIEIKDFKKLEKYGFKVISIPVNKEEAWMSLQKLRIALVRMNDPSSSIFKALKKSPDSATRVIVDEANLLIKLIGPKVNKKGESEWISI